MMFIPVWLFKALMIQAMFWLVLAVCLQSIRLRVKSNSQKSGGAIFDKYRCWYGEVELLSVAVCPA
jgi:hypothetical protein